MAESESAESAPATTDWTEAPHLRTPEVLEDLVSLAGKRVVDVGCGDGGLVRIMARAGATVIGIEARKSALTRARAETPVADERYLLGRGEALPLDDDEVDAVVYHNSLHHLPFEAQAKALAEARRVLGPGGRLVIFEPIPAGRYFELMRSIEDETEVRAHAQKVIREADQHGLREEREVVYRARLRFMHFEQFAAQVMVVDEAREEKFARLEGPLRRVFAETAERETEADGPRYAFDQPMRANLLVPN